MVRRLAAVIWWVGALSCALALFVAGNHLLARLGCSELVAKSAAMHREQDVAYKAAVAEFHRQHPGANLSIAEHMELDSLSVDGASALSDKESAKLKDCEGGPDLLAACRT